MVSLSTQLLRALQTSHFVKFLACVVAFTLISAALLSAGKQTALCITMDCSHAVFVSDEHFVATLRGGEM